MVVAGIQVTDSIERGLDTLFEWIPEALGAIAVLVIGYLIAKLLGKLAARLLARAGIDRLGASEHFGFVRKITASPSGLLGRVVFWVIMLGVISMAVEVLGIQAVKDVVARVYDYVPNVLAAIAILVVAGFLSSWVGTIVRRALGERPSGRILSTVAPVLILAIASFMVLDQLDIASEIVTITYAALMGAVALGMAIAFGLGGRDAAQEFLRETTRRPASGD